MELLDQVVGEAAPLAEAFSTAGYSLYLVGGIVRDLHLDAALGDLDFDLTTEARPDQIKRLIHPLAESVWTQGEKFGTIGATINGRPYEITTFRAESYNSDSRKPEVQFGDDLEVDLSRRDFTLNAMAVDLATGKLLDPYGGLAALSDRVLRTPIEPEVSFSDDPLRILRAARFIARYKLHVDPPVTAAAIAEINRMSIVSVERIREELEKLLAATTPSPGLAYLGEVGAWPFVSKSIPTGQLNNIGAELDRSAVEPTLRRAVLFSHCPAADRANALDHLKYSNAEARELRLILAGLDIVTHGEEPFVPSMVRRLIDRVGYESIPILLSLINVLGVSDREFADQFRELDAVEDLSDLAPGLSGEDVMDMLGIAPGPEVGAALSVLKERRFEDGPIDRAGEVAFLLDKYRAR